MNIDDMSITDLLEAVANKLTPEELVLVLKDELAKANFRAMIARQKRQ